MCGLTGFLNFARKDSAEALGRVVTAMNNTITHRGPDGGRTWVDADIGVALAHRRLAIIDLSEQGAQPMESASGRYVIVFNGEIYNFMALRHELEAVGHRFRGHSDTEVMLAAFETWGIVPSLQRFNGMFAIALWDRRDRILHLMRDRLGKKPLYYGGSAGKAFFFGSELKALRAHPEFRADVEPRALAGYISHNYVPAPLSIYKNVFKVPAGGWLSIDVNGDQQQGQYWALKDAAQGGLRTLWEDNDASAIEALETLLADATRLRMISDVPLGAFLSGGIDSSLVVALAAKISTTPVKTYSIGFEEAGFNESESARKIAEYLKTSHTEFFVTSEEARAVIPNLPEMFDEPFADSSQIPTYCVAHLARREVTVALSGDGGDEMFAGYTRYHQAESMARKLLLFPLPLRQMAATAMRPVGGRWPRYADVMQSENRDDLYKQFMTFWREPSDILVGGAWEWPVVDGLAPAPELDSFLSRMQYRDMLAYLPDDILVKIDRTSMAASLEARAPLLDYRVLEFSWHLPRHMKQRDGHGKWILRQILDRHVPRALYDRPKQGFGIPLGVWLRGPLKEWAGDLLASDTIAQQGFFNVNSVRRLWQEHVSGHTDHSYRLWGILMFQSWHARWK